MHRTTSPLLRGALYADALASGAMGLLMAGGADLLAPLLGLPRALLFWSGLALLPFALFVGWIARRREPPQVAVKAVLIVNLAWVTASALVLALLPVAPAALGYAFITLQALAVLALAAAQWIGLTRAHRSALA